MKNENMRIQSADALPRENGSVQLSETTIVDDVCRNRRSVHFRSNVVESSVVEERTGSPSVADESEEDVVGDGLTQLLFVERVDGT